MLRIVMFSALIRNKFDIDTEDPSTPAKEMSVVLHSLVKRRFPALKAQPISLTMIGMMEIDSSEAFDFEALESVQFWGVVGAREAYARPSS